MAEARDIIIIGAGHNGLVAPRSISPKLGSSHSFWNVSRRSAVVPSPLNFILVFVALGYLTRWDL